MSSYNYADNFSNPFPSISMSQESFNELNPLHVDSSHSFPFISDHQYALSSIPVMTPNHCDHQYALSSIPVMSPNYQSESNYEQTPYPASKIPSIIFDSIVAPNVDVDLNMPVPILQNVVSTAHLDVKLDLKQIAAHALNAEYNPKRFSALIMRIREPKTTSLIFNNGKIVCTGAKSVAASHLAARKFGRIIQKLGNPDTKFSQFKVQNIVCSCDMKFGIRLEALATVHYRFCTYEPELFPGLVYRMLKPMVVMLVFHSGKVVITRAQKKEDIDRGFRQIYPILKQFRR